MNYVRLREFRWL